jgi:hypothetical protein
VRGGRGSMDSATDGLQQLLEDRQTEEELLQLAAGTTVSGAPRSAPSRRPERHVPAKSTEPARPPAQDLATAVFADLTGCTSAELMRRAGEVTSRPAAGPLPPCRRPAAAGHFDQPARARSPPQCMPRLAELVASSSLLGSMRELGTRLGGLRKLWACHCQLRDLEGVGALPRLAELYLGHNAISDLQPLQGGRAAEPAGRQARLSCRWRRGGLAGRRLAHAGAPCHQQAHC